MESSIFKSRGGTVCNNEEFYLVATGKAELVRQAIPNFLALAWYGIFGGRKDSAGLDFWAAPDTSFLASESGLGLIASEDLDAA